MKFKKEKELEAKRNYELAKESFQELTGLEPGDLTLDEMKKMIEEMVIEVDKHEESLSVNEELYNKLEMKVRKKFNEEVDKLEKSFRRIMD